MNPRIFKQKGYLLLVSSILLITLGSVLYLSNLRFQQKISRQLYSTEQKNNDLQELNTLQLKALKDKRGYQLRGEDRLLNSYLSQKEKAAALARKTAREFREDSLSPSIVQLMELTQQRFQDWDQQLHYLASLTPEEAARKLQAGYQQATQLSEQWEQQYAAIQQVLTRRIQELAAEQERLSILNNTSFIILLVVVAGLMTWSVYAIRHQDYLKQQHDTTLRINAAARASQQEFSAAFEFASIGMALVALDGSFMRVNNSLCKLLGYTNRELKALSFQDITHPDDLNRDVDFVNQMLEGTIENYSMEKRYIHKDGSLIWVNLSVSMVNHADGKPKYFISQIENITELKSTQEQLEANAVKFRGIFNSAMQFIGFLAPDGTLLDANHTMLDFAGIRIEEVKGKKFWDCYWWQKDEETIENLKHAISEAAAGETVVYEVVVLGKEGAEMPILFSLKPLVDASGKVVAMLPEGRPIKEIVQAREQLVQKNEELEQFASMAAHDLKEPLRMVGNFMSLLKTKHAAQLDEKALRYIDFAINGSNRMSRLISDLLDYARLGSEHFPFEKIDPASLLKEITAMNDSLITQQSASITWTHLPRITGQKIAIQLLFQNLVMNALKYQVADHKPEIVITGADAADYWHFTIRDNGIGIPAEAHEKIFQVFSRLHTKDKYDGTGMGLATCKKIVGIHGGRIWVESSEGKGSSFHFTISKTAHE